MINTTQRTRRDAGFSLIEVLAVLGLMGIIMAMSLLMTRTTLNAVKGDGAMQSVLGTLRSARERAIADRRNLEIRFPNNNTITVYRREVTGTTETGAVTLLDTLVLENGVRFTAPTSTYISLDTPDGFGNGGALVFGSAVSYIFTSEGTFVDQSGEPLNGTIFLGRADDPLAGRAVTIFGPTALLHGYRWNGRAWQN